MKFMFFYYLSDLHIQSEDSAKAKLFQRFLEELPQNNDVLVFGGDIFDLFVGNKKFFRVRYKKIFTAVEKLLNKNCKIYYLEGNHDFHLSGLFDSNNFIVKQNDFFLEWGAKKIWVSHGDLIDPADHGYRLLRVVTRSLPLQGLVKILPGSWIQNIGGKSSKQSRKYNNDVRLSIEHKNRIRALYLAFAKEKIKKGYEFVFVGHSHLADDVAVVDELSTGRYVNVGFSPDVIPYAKIGGKEKEFELLVFR